MRAPTATLSRLRNAGFTLAMDGERLAVMPAHRLTAEQRLWISANRADLVAALRADADANVAAMVAAFGATVASVVPDTAQTHVSSSFHSPGAGYVRCCNCRHAVSAPLDEPGAWRLCAAGQRAGWSFQERVCSTWESAP